MTVTARHIPLVGDPLSDFLTQNLIQENPTRRKPIGLRQQAPKPSGRQGGKGKLVSKLSVPRHTQPPKEVLLYTNWTSRHVSCWKILGTFYSFALNLLVSSFCTRSVLERRFSHRGINNFGFSRLPKPPPQNLPLWEISKKMSTAPYRAGLLSCRGEP